MERYKFNVNTPSRKEVVLYPLYKEDGATQTISDVYFDDDNKLVEFHVPNTYTLSKGSVVVFERTVGNEVTREETYVESVELDGDSNTVKVKKPMTESFFISAVTPTVIETKIAMSTINGNVKYLKVENESVPSTFIDGGVIGKLRVSTNIDSGWTATVGVKDSSGKNVWTDADTIGKPTTGTRLDNLGEVAMSESGTINTQEQTISTIVVNKMVFRNDVRVYYVESGYNITFPLHSVVGTDMAKESNVREYFVEDVKNRILSSAKVIDMEKVMFTPMISPTSINNITFNVVDRIIFNFHFLKRKEDGWEVKSGEGWNGDVGSDLRTNIKKSDNLGYLNFTDDDVRYQQNKLKKTFIRLSFYDTDNPITQHLLYYSTIFFDTNELFGKYVRFKQKHGNESAVDGDESDNNLRVDTRLVVENKFNTEKSSEGFYLYLFNDTVTKNKPKDIYMKVEFNHAGYGRTIPFTKPYVTYSGSKPTVSAMPFNKFREMLYIKLTCAYIESEGRYVYFVAKDETNYGVVENTSAKEIIFSLFEANVDS